MAQWQAQETAKHPKVAKLAVNNALRQYVQARLAGKVHRIDGTVVDGPAASALEGVEQAASG